jgi:hypothetical protein
MHRQQYWLVQTPLALQAEAAGFAILTQGALGQLYVAHVVAGSGAGAGPGG